MTAIAFTPEERQELRLAIRFAMTDLSMSATARALLLSAYQALAQADNLSGSLRIGGPLRPRSVEDGLHQIGEIANSIVAQLEADLETEREATARAVANLGDRMASIGGVP